MKNIVLIFTLVLIVFACNKEEKRILFEGGTPPELKATISSGDSIPLADIRKDLEAIGFSWSNPNYMFTTGVSSQDVAYVLEIDKSGSNFSSSDKIQIGVSKELSYAFIDNDLNSKLGNVLKLVVGEKSSIEVRVVSSIGGSKTTELASNVLQFEVTTYVPPPTVPIPATGELWVTGDAFPSGWANPLAAPYDVSQKFDKISDTMYEGVFQFSGGGGYKIIQENGVWGTQYHALEGSTFAEGKFELKDSDPQFPGAPSAGKYKISIDFQSGIYKVTPE